MNAANYKRRRLIYIILMVVAVLLLLCGFYHINHFSKYINNGDKVRAYVENILEHPDQNSENYEQDVEHYQKLLQYYKDQNVIDQHVVVAIIISYTHNGNDITTDLNYFSQSIQIGQVITIYVNKADSYDFIYEKENKFGLYFCMIVGSVLLIATVGLFLIERHNSKCDLQLFKEGKVIVATVMYADEVEKKSKFGRHPFVFTCVYKNPETNEEIYFTSDNMYCKDYGINYIGKDIKIYVDPNDNTNYYIDCKQFEKI